MKEKFLKFMAGRYGGDQLSRDLLILFIVMNLLAMLCGWSILAWLSWLVLILAYYRMFSKNFAKRYNENRLYTNMMGPVYDMVAKIKTFFRKYLRRIKNWRQYRYFTCPKCHQELRVPRGKGAITIRCPKCQHSFDAKS